MFTCILVPEIALANIRAPRRRPVPEAQHLKSVGTVLAVKSENLKVECDQESCKFAVSYQLVNSAIESVTIDTTFVAPVNGTIQLTCPSGASAYSPLRSLALVDDAEKRAREGDDSPALSEATVRCEIPSGDSNIQINYEQLAGLYEEGVSYFSSSWFRRFFYYELAPLKEWRLSEDFKLNFQFTVPDEPIGFFSSLFGLDPNVVVKGMTRASNLFKKKTVAAR
jgi:hypothetical protein